MFKNIFMSVCIIAIMSVSTLAVAKGGWATWTKVDIVYSHNHGHFFVYMDPASAHINPDGCQTSRPYKIIATDANAKDMYKMLLTAKASGLTVSPYLYGCDGNYPRLLYTRIR